MWNPYSRKMYSVSDPANSFKWNSAYLVLWQISQVKMNSHKTLRLPQYHTARDGIGHDVINVINMDNKQDASGPPWNICRELSGLTVHSYYGN